MQELHRTLYRTLVDRGWYVNHSFTRQTVMLVIAGILGVASIGLGAVFGLFVGMSFFFAAIIMGIFAFFMPKPTADGIHMKKRVLGFKEFMHTAERYRAQWHEEEQMFTNYLPYAIAFDDVQRWAKTFEGVHTAQPDWYESNLPFNVAIFSTQFSGIQSALTIATAPKAPSGGGSGGGGFSGGGFGGGGGGSW